MLPLVLLLGCPNVGKSTLFNLLTCSFNAIVVDVFGTTRDRQYGTGLIGDFPYLLVDTGGIIFENLNNDLISSNVLCQVEEAIKESDIILFIIDLSVGLSKNDMLISKYLRKFNKKVLLVINKIDKVNTKDIYLDAYLLGFGHPVFISAKYNKNILKLVKTFLSIVYKNDVFLNKSYFLNNGIKVAVVGKPNVGKSTLINKILKKNRLIVMDKPGTTRDSIYIPLKFYNDNYIFIDTAGLRKKKSVIDETEKYSVIRSIRAIKYSHVVLLLIDIVNGISEQDIRLMKLIIDIGKCLIVIFNKCDQIVIDRNIYINNLKKNIPYFNIIIIHFMSSLLNIGIYRLFFYINLSYSCSVKKISSVFFFKILNYIFVKKEIKFLTKRIHVNYINTGGYNPLIFILHGKSLNKIMKAHKRFFVNIFIKKLKIVGAPIFFIFKLK